MSDVGPPVQEVLPMLAAGWLVASAALFPFAVLAYAGLVRWRGAAGRRAAWGLAFCGVGGALFWMTVGRALPVTWAQAYGEEVAFAHLCAGTAFLLALAWRRAPTSRT